MEALRTAFLVMGFGVACFPVLAAEIETLLTKAGTAISIEGELQPGDHKKFHDKVLGLDSGLVFFDSPGGNLVAGIEIGRAIRLKGLSTFVLDDALCASACALALLGGKVRFAGSEAKIAFHAAWVLKGGEARESGPGNALAGAYLNSLGLSDDAIVVFTMAPPDGAETLTREKAERLGVRAVEITSPTSPRVAEVPPRRDAPPPASTAAVPDRSSPPKVSEPSPVQTTLLDSLPSSWRLLREPEMIPQVLDLAN